MLVVGVVLVLKKYKNDKDIQPLPSSSPGIEQRIKETFNGLTIPSDSQKMELKDVSGGESFGIVTETEILAYLPQPLSGEAYKVWIVKNGQKSLIGELRESKGGWIINLDYYKYSNYEKIVVTGISGEILEGYF